jgi:hypothetical protein
MIRLKKRPIAMKYDPFPRPNLLRIPLSSKPELIMTVSRHELQRNSRELLEWFSTTKVASGSIIWLHREHVIIALQS